MDPTAPHGAPDGPPAQHVAPINLHAAEHAAQAVQADARGAHVAQLEQALRRELDPWQEAFGEPGAAQDAVLRRILGDFAKTRYGAGRQAEAVAASPAASAGSSEAPRAHAGLIAEYRRHFPIMTYAEYKPLIDQVMGGDTEILLWEPPIGWAITRGTTEDQPKGRLRNGVSPAGRAGHAQDEDAGSVNSSAIGATEDEVLSRSGRPDGRDSVPQLPVKFIPMTPTDLRLRVSAGRAMMAYVAATQRIDLFAGVNLNLNFPSVVGHVRVADRDIEYGYSSGIYTKHVSKLTPIRSVPSQEEIDQLSPGTTRAEWDARFELAIEKCRGENVTLVGVCARPRSSSASTCTANTASIPRSGGRPRS